MEISEAEVLAQRYPNVNFFLHRPLLTSPPMISLKDLSDGSYSIDDIQLLHEILDLKEEISKSGEQDD